MSDQATGGPSCELSTAVPDWLTQQSWRRSSFCTAGNCVEVATGVDSVLVRDSKHLSEEFVEVRWDVWEKETPKLLDGAGPVMLDDVVFCFEGGGGLTVNDARAEVLLSFDAQETTAFLRGLGAGEFGNVC